MSIGAVLSILFDTEQGNTTNEFIRQLQVEKANEHGYQLTNVKVEDFLRSVDFNEFWSYTGSLTTPPCTEGISWTVVKAI